MRAAIAILLVVLWPLQLLADEPHAALPMTPPADLTGDDVRVVLQQGERAPFAGILLDGTTFSRWTNRQLWYAQRLQLEHQIHADVELALRNANDQYVLTLRQSFERETNWLNAEIDRTREDLDAMRARAAALEERPWYRSFGFGMTLGAGVVLGGAILGAVLAK